MKSGLFCVFEGIDGSGKSTLQKLVGRLCREERWTTGEHFEEIALLCEPTDLPTGAKIRHLLQSGDPIPAVEWQQLFIADRRANVRRNIRPLLERGALILQDRYFYSTAAYQGGDPPDPAPEEILKENRNEGFPDPHLLFFLEIDPTIAIRRISESRSDREVFERLETLRRIAANYERILPDTAIRLAATSLPEELVQKVMREIRGVEL